MADTVDYYLEQMLPELDDLEKRALFTRSEIKEIVKTRREFEYLLKRHSTLRQDYLRYIEYEKKLEALRRVRKKKLVRDLQGTGEKWKHSLCDGASCRRIMLIYKRAVTKFKGDLALWLQYLEYCRSEGTRKMQKVATKCLQLHPTVPGLWMYAAAWEFEHNLNVKAARALMQRGLRICPRAENLWIEYFRLELTYMQKLKGRRLVLGLEPRKSAGKKSSKGNSLKIESEVFKEENEGPSKTAEGADTEVSVEDKLSYKLAQTVYRNAIAAIPVSVEFRHRFLEALDTFKFELKDDLEEQIQASITSDFATDEGSWDWLARRHVQSEQRAMQVFDDALEAIPSARMYELYATYLTGILDAETAAVNSSLHSIGREIGAHDIADILLQLFEKSSAGKISSEALAKGHLELLLRSGRVDEASKLGKEYCDRADLKKSASLWEWRIKVAMMRISSSSDQNIESKGVVVTLLQDAMKCVPFGESKRLWQITMEYCGGQEKLFSVISEMLEKAMAGGSGGQVGAEIACTFLKWVLLSQGIKQARQTYHRFLVLPGPSAEFLNLCISIEATQSSASETGSLEHLRKLFNEAAQRFGQNDTDLWLQYYREELRAGNVDAANNVYWRAKKTLKDPTCFLERHQMMS